MRFQRLFLPILWGWLLTGVLPAQEGDPSIARMKKDIYFLAGPECEGRGVNTQGINKAADHIAKELGQAGLKPGGVKGTWFQPFQISGGPSKLLPDNKLILRGPQGQKIHLKLDADFNVLGYSPSGKVEAPIVFVGHGIQAKEVGFDDYAGLDVKGKIVVLIRRVPRWGNDKLPFDGPRKDNHAALQTKQALAEIHKAAAVILVNDQSDIATGDKLEPFSKLVGLGMFASIPALHVHRDAIEPLVRSSLSKGLQEIEQLIDGDLKPRGAPLQGWTAQIETAVQRDMLHVKNVVGVLEGNGPLANETIVVGAHYDHLGLGGQGSLAKGSKDIHFGADDNASGTTSVIELARRFANMKDRQGRRLVFMLFSAEERGLLGSRHYCNQEPLFPLANTAAMVNLDMVGRLPIDPKTEKEKLLAWGTGTAKEFDALVDKLNPGFQYAKNPGGTGPSDHDSFFRKGVPVLFFWTGTHPDYHRPGDTPDKINLQGMKKIVDFSEKVVAHLSTQEKRPEFVKLEAKSGPMVSPGKGPRLGIRPGYDEAKPGVLVDTLVEGGAAEKGGLKAGDVIVELAGKAVSNINTYMTIMASQQSGQVLEIAVMRDGKKLNLKVTPQ